MPLIFNMTTHLYTKEEIERAKIKYWEDIKENDRLLEIEGKVDLSDWRCGLEFVMASYSTFTWEKYFENDCEKNKSPEHP